MLNCLIYDLINQNQGKKHGTEVTLKLSLDVVDFNDEDNFLHKFSLIPTQVSKLRKAFANSSQLI